jgi:PGF-pre-PGF domain-containing protein
MNNKNVLICLIVLISAFNVMAAPGGHLPAAYNGFVTIDGMLAKTVNVSVYDSSGKPAQELLFDNGSYQVRVVWDDPATPAIDGVFAGDTITFKVNGITATTWTVSEADTQNTKVNLAITTSSTSSTSSSSSSGVGGGGGGVSGEDFANIESKEKHDLYISRDMVASLRFNNSPVLYVNITGNTNEGDTDVALELLRNTSTLVKTPAPGKVYKNLNLWVGSSGFAVPKNIKEAVIRFKVENAWIASGGLKDTDIVLLRWDGAQWISLETVPGNKDSTYTYYDAKTNAFSPFAISGMKGEAKVTAAAVGAETPASQEPVKTKSTPGFGYVIAIAAFSALFLLRKKKG